jgi:hypothetical protein
MMYLLPPCFLLVEFAAPDNCVRYVLEMVLKDMRQSRVAVLWPQLDAEASVSTEGDQLLHLSSRQFVLMTAMGRSRCRQIGRAPAASAAQRTASNLGLLLRGLQFCIHGLVLLEGSIDLAMPLDDIECPTRSGGWFPSPANQPPRSPGSQPTLNSWMAHA